MEERSASPPRPAVVPALTIKTPTLPVKRSAAELRAAAGIAGPSSSVSPAVVVQQQSADQAIPAGLRAQLDLLTDVQRSAVLVYLSQLGTSSKFKFSSSDAAEELAAKGLASKAPTPSLSCWQQLSDALHGCIAPPAASTVLAAPAAAAPPLAPTPAVPTLSTSAAAAAASRTSFASHAPPLLSRGDSATVIQSVWRGKSQRRASAADPDSSTAPPKPVPPSTAGIEEDMPVLPPAVQAAFDAAAKVAAVEAVLEPMDNANGDSPAKLQRKPSNLLPGAASEKMGALPLPVPSFSALKVLPGLPSSIKSQPQAVPPPAAMAMPGMPGSISASPQLKI